MVKKCNSLWHYRLSNFVSFNTMQKILPLQELKFFFWMTPHQCHGSFDLPVLMTIFIFLMKTTFLFPIKQEQLDAPRGDFSTGVTDPQTDGRSDGQTHFRDVRTHLKNFHVLEENNFHTPDENNFHVPDENNFHVLDENNFPVLDEKKLSCS